MDKFQLFLDDLIQRIINKGDTVPSALVYLQEADEEEAKQSLQVLLDDEYDIILDHLYSLLPSQQREVVTGNVMPLPPIHLN